MLLCLDCSTHFAPIAFTGKFVFFFKKKNIFCFKLNFAVLVYHVAFLILVYHS